LWSAAIDWCAAALVFAPLLGAAPGTAPAAMSAESARTEKPEADTKASGADWRRIARAAGNSLQGLRAVWAREAAFRQEVIASALLTPVALCARVTPYERCALLVSLALVLVVELLNSAIEAVVDLASPDRHPLAGLAKDAGSAAVLLSCGIAAAVWFTILSAPQ
jgi:diacylglycerol kinase (ATP)